MLSHRLIFTALGFLVLGVAMGIFMGAAQDFRLMHVHVHVNLLGWVTLGMVGLLYLVRPQLQRGRLPEVHYWLHTLGLLVFMGGFAWGALSSEFQALSVAAGFGRRPGHPAAGRARGAEAAPGLTHPASGLPCAGRIAACAPRVLHACDIFGVAMQARGGRTCSRQRTALNGR